MAKTIGFTVIENTGGLPIGLQFDKSLLIAHEDVVGDVYYSAAFGATTQLWLGFYISNEQN